MFNFKQFGVEDNNCGMKIGVDSVLLGSYVNSEFDTKIDSSAIKNILDIGTGCGVLSLMMAQKFPNAKLDAVELDFDAAEQARENFKNSPFKNKYNVYNCDLIDFKSNKKYDLIISNPPYFSENYSSSILKREMARKIDFLPIEILIKSANSFLNQNGSIYLIYPDKNEKELTKQLNSNNLHILNKLLIKGNPEVKDKRIIFHIGALNETDITLPKEITIEITRGKYTKQYIDLTKDFYLKF